MGNPLSVFSRKDEPQEEAVAEVAVANPSFRRTREVQVANPSFRRGKPEAKPEAKPKFSHDNVASIGESVAMMLHSEFGHDHAELLGDHMVRGTMCYMCPAGEHADMPVLCRLSVAHTAVDSREYTEYSLIVGRSRNLHCVHLAVRKLHWMLRVQLRHRDQKLQPPCFVTSDTSLHPSSILT